MAFTDKLVAFDVQLMPGKDPRILFKNPGLSCNSFGLRFFSRRCRDVRLKSEGRDN